VDTWWNIHHPISEPNGMYASESWVQNLYALSVNEDSKSLTSLTFVTTQQTESKLSYVFAAPKVHNL